VPLRRLARHARESLEVPRDLVLGRYPEFVTGGPLPKGHVPVFVFHGLTPETFGPKLQHLASNGYVTLSAEELFQVIVGARVPPERAVALTFDDGRASVWSIGYPLLRRHGMKAIVFLVPGRTISRPGPLPPTWDDVREGSVAPETLFEQEATANPFLSWEEIEALARTGLFDFESHTLMHARVHTNPRVVGFVTPELLRGPGILDCPLIESHGADLPPGDVLLGTPILRSQPRTSEALRFLDDPAFRQACTDVVAAEGGAGFFRRPGWRARLTRAIAGRSVPGWLERPEERRAAIRRELLESKRLIEERTGKPVAHLCFPWHTSGPTAHALAREVGYRAAFCGKVPGVPITLPGGDPFRIARVGEDYVELLPGHGRARLGHVLSRKLTRRLRGQA
jgi:peptidoglycan/xylan/chitin deacetylase (PgdA/CDA1 family)